MPQAAAQLTEKSVDIFLSGVSSGFELDTTEVVLELKKSARNGTVLKKPVENPMLLENLIERAKAFHYVANHKQKRL